MTLLPAAHLGVHHLHAGLAARRLADKRLGAADAVPLLELAGELDAAAAGHQRDAHLERHSNVTSDKQLLNTIENLSHSGWAVLNSESRI